VKIVLIPFIAKNRPGLRRSKLDQYVI
jgi:hypothetical protein